MKIVNYLDVKISKNDIKENLNIECKEFYIHSLSKKRVGAGHYEISLNVETEKNSFWINSITTDMMLIDEINDDNDEAIKNAVLYVLKNN